VIEGLKYLISQEDRCQEGIENLVEIVWLGYLNWPVCILVCVGDKSIRGAS